MRRWRRMRQMRHFLDALLPMSFGGVPPRKPVPKSFAAYHPMKGEPPFGLHLDIGGSLGYFENIRMNVSRPTPFKSLPFYKAISIFASGRSCGIIRPL